MKLAVSALALLAALQTQVPPAAPVEAPAPQPWTGTLSEGLAELRAALAAHAREDVLGLAARIGAAARADGVEPARAARVLHDLGLARAGVDDLSGALADLRAAAGAAGPGAVRESALYAAGTARLLRAEALRREVPEIAKKLGLPEPPQDPQGPPLGAEGGPDPLDVARQAYLDARGDLLERLRVAARHADTRANLELVTRRLRELEQIEREREQQKQDQDQEQQQQPNPDQPPKDPDAKQEPKEPQEPKDPQESQPKPQEQDPKAEPQDEPKPEDAPPEPQESQAEPKEGEAQPKPEEGKLEERVLSREEVQRLLDQLDEIEKEAQAVRARLLERRRKPVAKDW